MTKLLLLMKTTNSNYWIEAKTSALIHRAGHETLSGNTAAYNTITKAVKHKNLHQPSPVTTPWVLVGSWCTKFILGIETVKTLAIKLLTFTDLF
ncbi:hypothetical protein E2C01_062493 [Portunus trituberculatus]|uniref:Uncharacterized protein n=1 Tax=Portunus trituberculatus TaxID=210409 RepID=A0A5B7HFG7_PORTR|nr:hypothetical protein [Portunus trituberculatus]